MSVEPTAVSPTPIASHTQALNSKVYDTPEGAALARCILDKALPFEPHDFQVEGICALLDGHDLLATMATGSGKTGYFIMLMLIMRAISQSKDQTLALGGRTFPKDPAMIIVCPTKALQQDMVSYSCSDSLQQIC
jgi:ATP-dependent helicase YprA (DUF1998 family)